MIRNFKFFLRCFLKFRNNHSFKTNFLFLAFDFLCKLIFSVKRLHLSFGSRTLKKKGYEILGKLPLENSHNFDFLLGRSPTGGCISLPLMESEKYNEWVFSLVEQMKPRVENAMGSHFEILWYEIQATVPLPDKQAGSFLYHTDDTPVPIKKIFLYLTDTSNKNGAFRAFDYELTDHLIGKGMLRSSSPGFPRQECQSLIPVNAEERLSVVEGSKGTFFIFDNNLIHKGTLPEEQHRIIISFEIVPSLQELTYERFLENVRTNTSKKFYINPFFKKLYSEVV